MIKYVLATAALILAAAGTTWIAGYRMGTERDVREAVQKRDALEWLRRDFNLSDTQFAAVRRLHESYAVVCEEHCRAIQDAARERNAVKAQPTPDAAAIAAAERKLAELRVVCETAITRHVREVAAQMSSAQGERYLALVLPKIKDFDHQGAADVSVGHRGH
jgi:hypothetical protein